MGGAGLGLKHLQRSPILLQSLKITLGRFVYSLNVQVVSHICDFDISAYWIRARTKNESIIILSFDFCHRPQSSDHGIRKTLFYKVFERPIAVLDDVMQNPDDLLFLSSQLKHDP